MRVTVLDIPDGAGCRQNARRDAFVAFGAGSHRPGRHVVRAHDLFEVLADRAQMLGENERSAAAVGPHDNVDGGIRKLCARIITHDDWVIPLRNFAIEDAGVGVPRELEIGNVLKVICQDDASSRHWQQLDATFHLRNILGFHCGVAGGENHGTVHEALYAAPTADRLIVDLYVRVGCAVGLEPLEVKWRWKAGARTLQLDRVSLTSAAGTESE